MATVTVALVGPGFMVLGVDGPFVERGLGGAVDRLRRLAALPPPVVVLDLHATTAVDAAGEAVLRDFVRTVEAFGARVDIRNGEHLDGVTLTGERDHTSAA